MYPENTNEPNGASSSHTWGQVVTAIAAPVTATIGAQVSGFEWLIPVGIVILAITVLLMLWESVIGQNIRRAFRRRSDNRTLAKSLEEYERIFEKSIIFQEVIEKIQGLEWADKRPPNYISIRNRLSSLNHDLKGVSGSRSAKLIFANSALRSNFEYVDAFLTYCDDFVVRGEVVYKDKREESEIQKLVAQFEKFRDDHNDVCDSINRKLKSVKLVPLYSGDYCFAVDKYFAKKPVD